MNFSHSLWRLITSCLLLSTILVPVKQPLGAQLSQVALTLTNRSHKSQTKSALDRLIAARKQLAQQVSSCNGGDILVRACPGNVPPASQSCQEPIAPCAIVEALKSTDRAIATLEQFLRPSRHKIQSR